MNLPPQLPLGGAGQGQLRRELASVPAAVAPPLAGFVGREAHDDREAALAGRIHVRKPVLVAVCGLWCTSRAEPELAVPVVADVKLLGVCDFGGSGSGHGGSFGLCVKAWPGGDA